MISLRSVGSYFGDAETGGAGAAAFAAQLLKVGGAFIVETPSDAIVDEEGVRGKCIAVALAGTGLSITCGGGAGKRPGSPVETSYTLGTSEPTSVAWRC
jgi:hypothetical protein